MRFDFILGLNVLTTFFAFVNVLYACHDYYIFCVKVIPKKPFYNQPSVSRIYAIAFNVYFRIWVACSNDVFISFFVLGRLLEIGRII